MQATSVNNDKRLKYWMSFVDKLCKFISTYFDHNTTKTGLLLEARLEFRSFLNKETVFITRFILRIHKLVLIIERGKEWYQNIYDMSLDLHLSLKCERDVRLEATVNLFTGSLLRLIQAIKLGEEHYKYYNALRSTGHLLLMTV